MEGLKTLSFQYLRMNTELWNNILAFDFDAPPSEYGFSTRLAKENYWTKNFTREAILEYKKFMYLAATSDLMVSPSVIVDDVWHLHLIFTLSYQEFCNILGKQIQHVPSTHNPEEFKKFKQARDRTKQLYKQEFGEPPQTIWERSSMYDSLHLSKAKLKLRAFLVIAILATIALSIPFYHALRPIYINIDNPYFMLGYVAIVLFTFGALEILNRHTMKKVVAEFDKRSFIYNLHPLELVYLKTQDLSAVINGEVNQLVEERVIAAHSTNVMELKQDYEGTKLEHLQIAQVMKQYGKSHYTWLLRKLKTKPLFRNTQNCMDAFIKYFGKSKKFARLFYANYAFLAIILLLGFTRLCTGILREKPILFIMFAVIALAVLIGFYLHRLTKMICTRIIPNLYKSEILPARNVEADWQWSYFLLGTAMLAPSFAATVKNESMWAKYDGNSGSGASSCSSCGGGSCGGGGCGGCGGG